MSTSAVEMEVPFAENVTAFITYLSTWREAICQVFLTDNLLRNV